MPAPVASGWSGCRVGLAPTGKAPPCHGARGKRSFSTHSTPVQNSIKRGFMQRRTFFTVTAASTATLAMPVITGATLAHGDTDDDSTNQRGQGASGGLDAAIRRFLVLPGTKSYLIHVGHGGAL